MANAGSGNGQGSRTRRFARLMLAISTSLFAATAFLLFEAGRSATRPFAVEMALAALVALVAPLGAVALLRRVSNRRTTAAAYLVFFLAAIIIGVIFALLAFAGTG